MPSDPGSANASKATYSAALLQLEYEQRIGNMVPMDVVNSTWTGAGENLKKILMSIPDRIAPQFGGENHHKLYRALVEELTHALSSLEIVYDFPAILKAGRPAGK
jgi:phage terminase Nu1 subunit (DNA packaging protein)